MIDPPALLSLPDAPSNLTKRAQKKWRLSGRVLVNQRILTALDLHTLEAYCMCYDTMEQARDELEAAGISVIDQDTGKPMRNPAAVLLQEIYREQKQTMLQFGASLFLNDPPK